MLRAEAGSPVKAAVQSIADIPEDTRWERRASRLTAVRDFISIRGTTAVSCHRISGLSQTVLSPDANRNRRAAAWQGARDNRWRNGTATHRRDLGSSKMGMKDLAVYESKQMRFKRSSPSGGRCG